MSAPLLGADRPTAPDDRPSTLGERGLAVPFTAPLLLGARIRQPAGEAPQLIIPGLGGRGVYVLGWAALLPIALPTLHDEALWHEIASLERVGPASLRHAARRVAVAGYAGRAARDAALAAQAAHAQARARLRSGLAARIGGRHAEDELEDLADRLAGIGFEPRSDAVPPRLAALDRLVGCAVEIAEGLFDGPERAAALVVAAGAQMTREAVSAVLHPLARAFGGSAATAPAVASKGDVAETLFRLEHLLDGWDHLGAAVRLAKGAARGSTVREALIGLPLMPIEAERWATCLRTTETLSAQRRRLLPRLTWSPEARLDFILRAERARAFAP